MGIVLIVTPRDPTHDSTVQQGTVEYEVLSGFNHGIEYEQWRYELKAIVWRATHDLGMALVQDCHAYELHDSDWGDIPDILVLASNWTFLCSYDADTATFKVNA